MNFLAHIYLSGSSEKQRIGNFIGDFVKGRDYEKYPEEVRKGILHHREIDSFTDKHEQYLKAKTIFRHLYGKYSGIIVDIVYDHFLASNWERYHPVPLVKFSRAFSFSLVRNYSILPLKVKYILPFIIKSNRLNTYANLKGIYKVFQIMEENTSLPSHSSKVMGVIQKKYNELDNNFLLFFKDICSVHLLH